MRGICDEGIPQRAKFGSDNRPKTLYLSEFAKRLFFDEKEYALVVDILWLSGATSTKYQQWIEGDIFRFKDKIKAT